jgi:hypothetical protein
MPDAAGGEVDWINRLRFKSGGAEVGITRCFIRGWRFKGGPQQMSLRMAKALGNELIVGSPVSRVSTAALSGRVVVESARAVVSARRVIVAMSPADTKRISFIPALPPARKGLAQGWPGEPSVKINLVYKSPFWRDAGLSGLGVSDGAAGVTFDNSPPDGSSRRVSRRRLLDARAFLLVSGGTLALHESVGQVSGDRRESDRTIRLQRDGLFHHRSPVLSCHPRRCSAHAISPATGRTSHSLIGSRPASTTGRNRIAS